MLRWAISLHCKRFNATVKCSPCSKPLIGLVVKRFGDMDSGRLRNENRLDHPRLFYSTYSGAIEASIILIFLCNANTDRVCVSVCGCELWHMKRGYHSWTLYCRIMKQKQNAKKNSLTVSLQGFRFIILQSEIMFVRYDNTWRNGDKDSC